MRACVCVPSTPIIDTKSIFIMNNTIPAFETQRWKRGAGWGSDRWLQRERGREQSAANKELKDVLYLRITVVHSKWCVNCFTVFSLWADETVQAVWLHCQISKNRHRDTGKNARMLHSQPTPRHKWVHLTSSIHSWISGLYSSFWNMATKTWKVMWTTEI